MFVNKVFTKRINNVTRDESDWLLSYLHGVSTSSHLSLMIRPHLTIEYGSSFITITISKCGTLTRGTTWQFVGLGEAAAITCQLTLATAGDNRSTYHTATYDYEEARAGDRVCSLGERPYFDAASVSRREALAVAKV